MRKYFLAAALTMGILKSFAGDIQYPVSTIPAALLTGANVVKRVEEMRFEIVSTSKTIMHYKYALTILNEAGDDAAEFTEWYDQLNKINSIEGTLYDATGKQLKKVKSRDIQDLSAVDNNNLMDDNRYKKHNFYYKVYPYTVEYEAEVESNNTFHFPRWVPQDREMLSVEKSTYTLVCPADYTVRYRMFQYNGSPVTGMEKNKKTLQWQAGNIAAIKRPFASPVWNELTTAVYFAPTDFEIEGYKGVMSSWADLGKFQIALNQNRDKLPDNIVQKVQELTAGITDTKEKVKVLYNYLQHNTRYISIQLGIGGWQPFEASYVAQKGYGDCKALSNYMYSLLKAAGIRSNYTIVHAGDRKEDKKILEDFPSNQSNHIILCVPLQKDSMWLECTDQSAPAGYMGSFTGNRKALLVNETGGVLVATPRYGLQENVQARNISGVLKEDGTLDATIKTLYRATRQDDLHMMLTYLSKDKLKKELNEGFELPTYDINNFKYNEKAEALPEIDEALDLSIASYATISGKRLFVAPNVLTRNRTRIATDEKRLFDFVFDEEYRDVDTVVIDIPNGYEPEAMPQDVNLHTKYGTYSSSVKIAANKLTYVRTREQYAGRFSPAEQAEIAKYFEAIYKADHNRVVMIKKGA